MTPVKNLLLLAISTLLALAFAEIFLRSFLPAPSGYFVWPPNLKRQFQPTPAIFKGIEGISNFTINRQGLRGDSFSDVEKIRILTIGGSTTECLLLDDFEAWPWLLQKQINQQLGKPFSVVGNAGRSGHSTRNHILQLQYLLPQIGNVDILIMIVGANDLHYVISDPDYKPMEWTPEKKEEMLDWSFAQRPGFESEYPLFKRTEIWRRLRLSKRRYLQSGRRGIEQDRYGRILKKLRQLRQQATLNYDLPNLEQGIAEYRTNLGIILGIARKEGTRIIFVTQPTIWKSDLSNQFMSMLWMGGIGDFMKVKSDQYYSVSVMQEVAAKYNDALLNFCADTGAECFDLANRLPKDDSVFYDDLHFNEAGARRVADLLAQHLFPR